MSRLYLSPPEVGPNDRDALLNAFDSGWIAPVGPDVDAFEIELAEVAGVAAAAALASGTAALHLALLLAGVGPGHEVLVPTLTFAATANAVTYVGAKPTFVDSETSTWNIDPELVADYLTARSKVGELPAAVIAVDLYGQCADADRLAAACDHHGVALIEDAAEAIGASYKGRAAGSLAPLGVFSFNGNKMITTSGGGALVSDNVEFIERARYLASQARQPAVHYEHSEIGFNYRLSNLLAALGRSQLRTLSTRVLHHQKTKDRYRSGLSDLPGMTLMPDNADGEPTNWLTVLQIDAQLFGATPETVRLALEAQDIESRPAWKPMHLQSAYAGSTFLGETVAEDIFSRGLCVPSGSSITESEIDRVIEIIRGTARPSV
ncbi:MAG: aminotransferase class I/II-fold pyridoxal phosphate-dependent enzyme [Actinomycetes bacterium]